MRSRGIQNEKYARKERKSSRKKTIRARVIWMCPTILKNSNGSSLLCVCVWKIARERVEELKSNMAMVVDTADLNNFAWSQNQKTNSSLVRVEFSFFAGPYLFKSLSFAQQASAHFTWSFGQIKRQNYSLMSSETESYIMSKISRLNI